MKFAAIIWIFYNFQIQKRIVPADIIRWNIKSCLNLKVFEQNHTKMATVSNQAKMTHERSTGSIHWYSLSTHTISQIKIFFPALMPENLFPLIIITIMQMIFMKISKRNWFFKTLIGSEPERVNAFKAPFIAYADFFSCVIDKKLFCLMRWFWGIWTIKL